MAANPTVTSRTEGGAKVDAGSVHRDGLKSRVTGAIARKGGSRGSRTVSRNPCSGELPSVQYTTYKGLGGVKFPDSILFSTEAGSPSTISRHRCPDSMPAPISR